MPGHKIHALALHWIFSSQHGVYVGNGRGLRNATLRHFGKAVALHLQAPSASSGILLKLRLDPVRCRKNALARPQVLTYGGEGAAVVEAHQRGDRLLYFANGNLLQSAANRRVNGSGRDGFADGAEIQRVFGGSMDGSSMGGSSMRGSSMRSRYRPHA